jgi:hypothetical protein
MDCTSTLQSHDYFKLEAHLVIRVMFEFKHVCSFSLEQDYMKNAC